VGMERHPLLHAPLHVYPARPPSARSRPSWRQKCAEIDVANQALRGLRQLCRGEFDDSILGDAERDPPVQVTPLGRAAADAVLEEVRRRPPPQD
jgi:hypothetical protein